MLENVKLISIIREVEAYHALKIMEALKEEGITHFEVSLSDENLGMECIKAAQKHFAGKDVKVGAGTVLRKAQIDKLASWEVPFILTPGFDEEIVDYALSKDMEILPGILTPTDVQKAVGHSLRLLKLFPADAFGYSYLKSLKGPFPEIDFVAVGGVTACNARSFLENGFAGIAAGSNLVPKWATEKDIEAIRKTARKYVRACLVSVH